MKTEMSHGHYMHNRVSLQQQKLIEVIKIRKSNYFLGYHTHARKQNRMRRVKKIKDCDYKILVVHSKDQKFLFWSKFLCQILYWHRRHHSAHLLQDYLNFPSNLQIEV